MKKFSDFNIHVEHTNIRTIEPIKVKGQLGLFNIEY